MTHCKPHSRLRAAMLSAGSLLILLCGPSLLWGHALVVDVDPITPGIQTAIGLTPGTIFTVDIVLISDGVSAFTAWGIQTEFNDVPGILTWAAGSNTAGPATNGAPADFVGAGFAPPGTPLGSLGLAPAGAGPGGAFTASDGGSGIGLVVPAPGFGFPAAPGGTIVLETLTFTVSLAAPVGSSTDIAPLGAIVPLFPGGAPIPPTVAGGDPFYDFFGVGSFAALPVGASPFPAAINPGTITVVPEPSTLTLAALGLFGLGFFGWRRRRRSS